MRISDWSSDVCSSDLEPQPVDTLITGAVVVTMNEEREVFRDGAVAIDGRHVVAVGQTADVTARFRGKETIRGERFAVVPGMVNTHYHITGEPLTRGYVPDSTPFEENVYVWLCQLYAVHGEADERLSAQLAAAEMLRSGTTSFLEAGTVGRSEERRVGKEGVWTGR